MPQESAERESAIIGRQHDEEVVRREVVEARMNRWYNRLLNRHQDDPVSIICWLVMYCILIGLLPYVKFSLLLSLSIAVISLYACTRVALIGCLLFLFEFFPHH